MTKNYIKFKNRIIFVHIAIMLIWIGFGVRLFNIQVINRLNSPQGIKVESINGLRGNFYDINGCLLYTSPSPRDPKTSRMPSSA